MKLLVWHFQVGILRLAIGSCKRNNKYLVLWFADVSFAFDPGVARGLKGNTPRRSVKISSIGEAMTSWRTLVGELSEALEMFKLDRFHQIRSAVERLSQKGPNILTCSFLQMHLYTEDLTLGRHMGKDVLCCRGLFSRNADV